MLFCANWPQIASGCIVLVETFHFICHTRYTCDNFVILHPMTPNHPRAVLCSSRPFIWYVTRHTCDNFVIFAPNDPEHWKPTNDLGSRSRWKILMPGVFSWSMNSQGQIVFVLQPKVCFWPWESKLTLCQGQGERAWSNDYVYEVWTLSVK